MLALLTRPQIDSQGIAEALQQRGIETLSAPMLDIIPIPQQTVDLAGVQGILATSANGVRFLAQATEDRELPVYAVGNATASVAREHGYRRVESAAGDVASLADLVRRRVDPVQGALIHAAGTAVAGDLAGDLTASGYSLRRVQLYEARKADHLSTEACDALAQHAVDYALFFSPRTAATFVSLVRQAGLGQTCRTVKALCLSRAVAEKLAELDWRRMIVAAHPDQDSLLAALDEDRKE